MRARALLALLVAGCGGAAELRAPSPPTASSEPTAAQIADREDRALLAVWGLPESVLGATTREESLATRRRAAGLGTGAATAAPLPAEPFCPEIELRDIAGWDATHAAPGLRMLFSRNATEDVPADALIDELDRPSPVLAIAHETRACPVWLDGELLGFDEPTLGVLPFNQWSDYSPIRTYDMDRALEAREMIAELRTWLAERPSEFLVTADGTGAVAHVALRDDGAIVCVSPEEYADAPVLGTGRCFAVSPPPARVAVDAERVWDESGDHFAAADVWLELDGRTFTVAPEGLVRARRRRFSSWHVETGASRAGGPIVATEIEPDAIPRSVRASLRYERRLGDACIDGGAFCCVVDGAWACADPIDAMRTGEILEDTIVAGSGRLRFTAEHGDGVHLYSSTNSVIHLFVVEGDVLVERGSFETRWVHEDGVYDEDGEIGDWGRRDTAWSYRLVGDGCVEYVEATETGAHIDASTHGREVPDAFPIEEWAPAGDVLPRIAPRLDASSMRGGPRDSDLRIQLTDPIRWRVADRRGSWRLDDDGWHRVASCE